MIAYFAPNVRMNGRDEPQFTQSTKALGGNVSAPDKLTLNFRYAVSILLLQKIEAKCIFPRKCHLAWPSRSTCESNRLNSLLASRQIADKRQLKRFPLNALYNTHPDQQPPSMPRS